MLRVGTVVFGADDVERAVAFWSAALGYDPGPLSRFRRRSSD